MCVGLQMQLTRSKLKYWIIEHHPKQMFGWTEWPLRRLLLMLLLLVLVFAMLMNCGWQTIFIFNIIIRCWWTNIDTLRPIVCSVRLHSVVQMVYMMRFRYAHSKHRYVHTAVYRKPCCCIMFPCSHVCSYALCRVPFAFFHMKPTWCLQYRWDAHIVREPSSSSSVYQWYKVSLSLTKCLSKKRNGTVWFGSVRNAMQNPLLYTSIEHVFLCFRLFLHSFFFLLLHYIMCHWFAFSEWIQWFPTKLNRTESKPARFSLCIAQWHRPNNSRKNEHMLSACLYIETKLHPISVPFIHFLYAVKHFGQAHLLFTTLSLSPHEHFIISLKFHW